MRLGLSADPVLFIGYILSSCLSLIMLGSISPDRLLQQSLVFLLGIIILLYLSRQEDGVFKSFAIGAYALSLLALTITILFATVTRGTLSWLNIAGFSIQPSELTKPFLILTFAYLLDRFPPIKISNILLNFFSYLLPAALILQQPDLGTTLVITAIWLTQLFIAAIPWRYVIIGSIICLASLPLAYSNLKEYQVDRLTTFLNPFADPLGSGYNVIQSMIAVGSGGILGKGLGQGTQSHLRFLPERHTDFAFAAIAEELGLIGSFAILAIMSIFIFRLLNTLTQAKINHNRLILAGSLAYFAFQSLLNIGMNIGVAPVTGITLPLISYGGSSILSTAIVLGIASSIIRGSSPKRLLEIR